jgi:heptosyltransferase I
MTVGSRRGLAVVWNLKGRGIILGRYLIARLSALGDTVCCLPVAVALKRTHPDCSIVWAVDPRFAGVVECCSAVDEVVRVKPSWKSIPRFEGEFDAALDLQGLLKSALCVAVAKSGRKVGYHWQREGSSFFSERILPDPSSLHVVDQYMDVARALGSEQESAEFGLVPKTEDLETISARLAELKVEGGVAVLNAGAGWASKRWPAEHFSHLVARIYGAGLTPILIGGKAAGDVSAAEEVIRLCPKPPISLLGQTNIRQLIALVSMAKVHVGGDTGSTHIAAALGIPAIGLYSITRPERSCPYGQVSRCLYHPRGLAQITPEAVWEKIIGSSIF